MEEKWRKLIEGLKRQDNAGKKKTVNWKEIGLSKLVIIFMAGVFLLILSLPSGSMSVKKDSTKNGTKKETTVQTVQDTAAQAMKQYAGEQEKELERLLSKVEGIGEVDVMLTIASSEEKRTLQQEDHTSSTSRESDSTGGTRNQTQGSSKTEPVLVGEDGKEPFVVQVQSPQVEGVLVVAQGAGSGMIDSEIIAAVEALFPIEPHKIKVMKMGSPK